MRECENECGAKPEIFKSEDSIGRRWDERSKGYTFDQSRQIIVHGCGQNILHVI